MYDDEGHEYMGARRMSTRGMSMWGEGNECMGTRGMKVRGMSVWGQGE